MEYLKEFGDIYKRLEKGLEPALVDQEQWKRDKTYLWHENRILVPSDPFPTLLKWTDESSSHVGANLTLKLFKQWFHSTRTDDQLRKISQPIVDKCPCRSCKPGDFRDRGLYSTLRIPHCANSVLYVDYTEMLKFGGYDLALVVREVGRSTRDWGGPAGGSYQGAFAQPPTALLHVPAQSSSPTWGKGAVAASSTLPRVLPGDVTHVRPKSHNPLLRADDTWGRIPSHILINLPDSGAQGPGARPKALSCRHPHLGWGSVGVRRLEEARATGLACRGAHSRLLTRSSLRSPGGPGVRSRSLWLVGRSLNHRISAMLYVSGYGRRRAWRIMVSPTHGTLFPFRPLHAWLVWCCPACVQSVHCHFFFFCSSLLGPRLSQPPYGQLVRREVDYAAARAGVARCCLRCRPG